VTNQSSSIVAGLRNRNRRRWLAAAGACVATSAPTARVASADVALRFGTTPVFLDDQIALLARWQRHLEDQLVRPVRFVQRASYREIVDLLLSDAIDVAWLCGFPYVVHAQRLALVAVPTYQGAPLYRSYLIVPERDTATTHIAALRGRVFAFSDPLSNSGYLVPRVELLRAGHRPSQFFRRTFFTLGHRKVVEAVRVGLADAGAVDGYVWDTLVRQQPDATRGVRVAWRSPLYGFPPVVARRSMPAQERDAFASALTHMTASPAGASLLERLNLDRFEAGSTALFDGIGRLVQTSEGAVR
jgi:phosphonate transport system substrate-binding protein